MGEEFFLKDMAGGRTFHETSKIPEKDFWGGYLLGLQRYFYGEAFGTTKEHTRLMELAAARYDYELHHRACGIGYRLGLSGAHLEIAVERSDSLAVWLNKRMNLDEGKNLNQLRVSQV